MSTTGRGKRLPFLSSSQKGKDLAHIKERGKKGEQREPSTKKRGIPRLVHWGGKYASLEKKKTGSDKEEESHP